jgi:hypothetical protein
VRSFSNILLEHATLHEFEVISGENNCSDVSLEFIEVCRMHFTSNDSVANLNCIFHIWIYENGDLIKLNENSAVTHPSAPQTRHFWSGCGSGHVDAKN